MRSSKPAPAPAPNPNALVLTTETPRALYIRQPIQPMSETEITLALQSIPEQHPWWIAINQLLAQRQIQATLDVSSDTAPADRVRHAGGRLAESAEFSALLWRKAGRTPAKVSPA